MTPAPSPTKWWDVRARARTMWEQVKSENAAPEKLGLAFGVGVFWALSPFHGFQFLFCLATAWMFRLNKLAALIGLQVSFPPLVPAILFVELQFGALLRRQEFLALSLSEIRAMSTDELARTLLVDLLVGGFSFGAIVSVILGFVTTAVVRRHRARKATQG